MRLVVVLLCWEAKQTMSVTACGADLNNDGGVISTPNFPNAYDHARVCTWNIVVQEDRRVTLTFNAFAVEDPYPENGVCYYDHVEVSLTVAKPCFSCIFFPQVINCRCCFKYRSIYQ